MSAALTFLGHSGFLAELPSVTLLFDWTEGDLPEPRRDVPLCVFASHAHGDHFSPAIFRLDDGTRDVRFLLGHDLKLNPRNARRWGLSEKTQALCRTVRGGQALDLPFARIEPLLSTDEGEAFLVRADGYTLFHAGDLNWWHWEGEDPGWNRNMEVNFRRYAEPLRGRRIDAAMVPLDPRLGEDGFRGPQYFLELADIRRLLPMHQWGDFGFTEKFLARFPQYRDRVLSITAPGQRADLP